MNALSVVDESGYLWEDAEQDSDHLPLSLLAVSKKVYELKTLNSCPEFSSLRKIINFVYQIL